VTDIEKLNALRAVFKTGQALPGTREPLMAEGLIEADGGPMLRWTNVLLTPKGIAEAERLGAADPATQRLRVWKNDVTEWVIAETPEEATAHLAVYIKEIGASPEEMDTEWRECAADKPFTMRAEEGGFTRLPAQWAALEGPGFLGSTEY
jgi:hypothetical protein